MHKKLAPITLALLAPFTAQAADVPPSDLTEPTKCYRMAWDSKEAGGLGLTAGQSVALCSGATDAKRVVLCYAVAWGHPDKGGLGLTAGQAVALCKSNSLPLN